MRASIRAASCRRPWSPRTQVKLLRYDLLWLY
jgi:hypothetical protein